MTSHPHYTVTISSLTIIKVIIVFLGMVFLYLVRDIVLIVFLSLIFASAIEPVVARLEKYHLPRWLSLVLIYILLVGLLTLVISQLIPAIQHETRAIISNFPQAYANVVEILGKYNFWPGLEDDPRAAASEFVQRIQPWLSPSKLFSAAFGVLGALATLVLMLVLTFYLVVSDRGLKRALRSLVPVHDQPYVTDLVARIQHKMGLWLRGQILLSLIIFVVVWIGLLVLDVPYSLLLALMAGLLEILPLFGPVLAALMAIFFVLAKGELVKALLVLGLYIVVQQLENHVIVPKIMQKATGLNPIISILALLIGLKLAGVPGGLIAIPVATALSVVAQDIIRRRENTS